MIEGFDHVGTDHKCNVCQCDFTDDEGGVQGYLGILPVAFCPTCFAGLCDMVEQLDGREFEGLTDVLDFIEEFTGAERERHPMFSDGYDLALSHVKELVQAKLKEDGYEG